MACTKLWVAYAHVMAVGGTPHAFIFGEQVEAVVARISGIANAKTSMSITNTMARAAAWAQLFQTVFAKPHLAAHAQARAVVADAVATAVRDGAIHKAAVIAGKRVHAKTKVADVITKTMV